MVGFIVQAAVGAAEIDPTVQPTRASFYVFVILATALVLLLWSFMRHIRRAQTNLGSAREADLEAARNARRAAGATSPTAPSTTDGTDLS